MIVIDATNLIVGRMATWIAKKALMGEEINVVNCENAVITGKKRSVLKRYREKYEIGDALKGPYFPKMPDRFIRRVIRGMVPYKQKKGELAYKRVMCYLGVPSEFNDKKLETIKNADVSNSRVLSYITVGDVCKNLKK
jgi:large subunit ribosomal protein L13